jgi:hypothetical protein
MITLVKLLQSCYPERLGVLMVIDPPFWMRAVFNLVWPFLSTSTREKIKMSSEDLHDLLGGDDKFEKMMGVAPNSPEDLIDYLQKPFYGVECL